MADAKFFGYDAWAVSSDQHLPTGVLGVRGVTFFWKARRHAIERWPTSPLRIRLDAFPGIVSSRIYARHEWVIFLSYWTEVIIGPDP